MRKRLICLVLMLFSISYAFSMLVEEDSSLRKNTDYFMKFRGGTSLIVAYYPAVHDGVSTGFNFSAANYSPLDYTDNQLHYTNGAEGRIIGSTWGGIEAGSYANFAMIAPFLNNDDIALFKNNNVKLNFLWELTPVSLEAGATFTWEPVAFFIIESGFKIGSAWPFVTIANGMGINENGTIQRAAFAGPHMNIWFKPQFQFDLSALMPQDISRWTHILMVAAPIFEYNAILNYSDTTAWEYKNDGGQNFNGWNLKSLFLLAYRIPVLIDDKGEDRTFVKVYHNNFDITVGFLMQIDYLRLTHYNLSPMSKGGWGSDFTYIEFGPIMNFDLPNNYFVNIFFFFKNAPQYTSETVGNKDFRYREYQDWYVYFRRIAFEFGWKF